MKRMNDLNAEDQKLVTLAKGARARIGSKAGACVRDSDGRTYSGAAVSYAGNDFKALDLAVASALAAGAAKLEAVCVLGNEVVDEVSVRTVLQNDGNIIICDASGSVVSVSK
jgi:cytidine deaminase